MNLAQFTLIGAVRIYRAIVSPVLTVVFTPLGFGCRFHPTCSQYAAEAIRTHGACKGAWLAVRRLCRCHPWGGSGEDPVPGRGGAPSPTACSADFSRPVGTGSPISNGQSVDMSERSEEATPCRLEALRYSRSESCATPSANSDPPRAD